MSGGLRAESRNVSCATFHCVLLTQQPVPTVALGAGENALPPSSLIWFNSRSEIKATAARNQQKQGSGHKNISPENWQKSLGLGGLHVAPAHTPHVRGGDGSRRLSYGFGAFIPLSCQDSQTVVPSHPHGQHLETCENAISFLFFLGFLKLIYF